MSEGMLLESVMRTECDAGAGDSKTSCPQRNQGQDEINHRGHRGKKGNRFIEFRASKRVFAEVQTAAKAAETSRNHPGSSQWTIVVKKLITITTFSDETSRVKEQFQLRLTKKMPGSSPSGGRCFGFMRAIGERYLALYGGHVYRFSTGTGHGPSGSGETRLRTRSDSYSLR